MAGSKKTVNNNTKLLVIGLDGGTFKVIDPLIEEGKLPNIERFIKEGVRGELLSTMPPVTGPAWSSFMTGKSPGAHGIFDFVRPLPDDFRRRIVNYKHIKSKTLWSILSENGKKIGIINVPLTYPPPEVNGFLVSGMLTPSIKSQHTYPASLSNELNEKFGQYILDIWWQHYGPRRIENFLQDLIYCTNKRGKIALHLMQNREWDFFMTVFIGTDRVQHALWRLLFLTSKHDLSRANKAIRELILEYYQLVDDIIGRIFSKIEKRANLIIMSDHGFGPLKGKVYINKWLKDLELLSFDHKKLRNFDIQMKLAPALRNSVKKLDFLNLRKKLLPNIRKNPARGGAYRFLDCIDWSKTVAYAASNTEQGIYINLAGREPYGIVQPGRDLEKTRDSIMESLRDLEHPQTKEKIVSGVYRKEDIYSGRYLDNAPDIIFSLKEGEYLADVQPKDYLFEKLSWKTGSGTHRMEGIFIAHGEDVKKGLDIEGARIIDLAPTILNMMNVPIPNDMEGEVLGQIFSDEFMKKNPPQYAEPTETVDSATIASRVYSFEEEAMVEKELRDLGYL
jgi:predicted AlkP superfamily phosphohydrolase/phosphomutase